MEFIFAGFSPTELELDYNNTNAPFPYSLALDFKPLELK